MLWLVKGIYLISLLFYAHYPLIPLIEKDRKQINHNLSLGLNFHSFTLNF